MVPVWDRVFFKPGASYLEPNREMPFADYLSALEAGPSDVRLFLFNVLKNLPESMDDFSTSTVIGGFAKSFPFIFFGGEGATVRMHYDVDRAHVFLSECEGRKHVILFPPSESRLLH